MKAGSGDLAGARDDFAAAHNLARLLGQGATLIDRLVSFAIDITASDAEAAIAAAGKLDAGQAQQWLSALHELAPIASLSEPIDNGEPLTSRSTSCSTSTATACNTLPTCLPTATSTLR